MAFAQIRERLLVVPAVEGHDIRSAAFRSLLLQRLQTLQFPDAWRGPGLEEIQDDVVPAHPMQREAFSAFILDDDVGDALAADGLSVAVVGGPEERDLVETVRRAMGAASVALDGLDTPRTLAAVLRRARLFVGNDSGVMHCAATMGVPTVGIFGLTNHRAWGPYPPDEHRVVRLDLACSPCVHHAFSLGTPRGCPARSCLEELEPAQVIQAARELLGSAIRRQGSDVAAGPFEAAGPRPLAPVPDPGSAHA